MASISPLRATTFYRAMRSLLQNDRASSEVLAAFEADPAQNRAALAALLRTRLPEDQALADALAAALYGEGATGAIVVNSQIDHFVSAASIGALNLTVKRYFYVFGSIAEVYATFSVLVLVAVAIVGVRWWLNQPRVMSGQFNIAVATFGGSDDPKLGELVSGRLFDFLEGEYRLQGFDQHAIDISHRNIGVISAGEEAKQLAKQVNAHLVLYGDVVAIGNLVEIRPRFFVQDEFSYDVGAISSHFADIALEQAELIRPAEEYWRLNRSAAALVNFTKGLAYISADKYELALASLEIALRGMPAAEVPTGAETILLFASHAALMLNRFDDALLYIRQALTLKPHYARAYIARGNVYYKQRNFELAMKSFELALQQEPQSLGDLIPEKAHLGLGNVFTEQLILDVTASAAKKDEYATLAQVHYRKVLTVVDAHDAPSAGSINRKAWAYYGIALVSTAIGDCAASFSALRQAEELAVEAALIKRLEAAERYQRQQGCREAQAAHQLKIISDLSVIAVLPQRIREPQLI